MAVSGGFAGETALVTGAGRGLGRAIATGLAQAGATVWICARTTSELELTEAGIRETGGRAVVRPADLADPESCLALAADITAAGPVDILVNNAAVLDLIPVAELPLATWARALAVNLTAPFVLTRALLPGMRRRGGAIVNVSSRAGVLPFANEAAYCASKFGLEGFTKALALELTGEPVSVNTVTPGLRIKPTSITDEEAARGGVAGAAEWQDPMLLLPAFLYLAGLRGEVSGQRFDAHRLSVALAGMTELAPRAALELAE